MNPVFCAIDATDLSVVDALINDVQSCVGGIKLGMEFYMAHGAEGVKHVARLGLPIFLDLKLHDIPNTVSAGVRSLLPLKTAFLTIHAAGGKAMMEAAVRAATEFGNLRPKLLAVTVLTSLDAQDLVSTGQDKDVAQQVLRLARLAKESGMDGVICSPAEINVLRADLGPDFILMVPGIRPAWAASNDQKRTMGPREACAAGATYLVIGRPITSAEYPKEAAQRIMEELS